MCVCVSLCVVGGGGGIREIKALCVEAEAQTRDLVVDLQVDALVWLDANHLLTHSMTRKMLTLG